MRAPGRQYLVCRPGLPLSRGDEKERWESSVAFVPLAAARARLRLPSGGRRRIMQKSLDRPGGARHEPVNAKPWAKPGAQSGARGAVPHAAADADDTAVRGARLGRLPRRQNLWRRALLYRRGGGCGRCLFGAGARGPDHLDASRPRPLHRQGCRPQPHDGRALRPADRVLQGQGRFDAHRRFRHRHARRQRHRRGRDRDRDRRRPRRADGEEGLASPSRFSATAPRMPGRSTNA